MPPAPPVTTATFPLSSSPMVTHPFRSTALGHGSTPCRTKISSIAARSAASSVQSSARGVVVDLGHRPAADQRRAHAGRRGRPPQRELRDGVAARLGEVAQVVDDRDVLGDPARAEEVLEQRRHHAPLVGLRAPVVGRERVVGGQRAAQEPVRERAVAEEADVVRRAPGEERRPPSGGRTARARTARRRCGEPSSTPAPRRG